MSVGHLPVGAHLVGSVPLQSEDEVFHVATQVLAERLKRMPDGETGERLNWIGWQAQVFADNHDFTPVAPTDGYGVPIAFALRPGADLDKLRFESLGYAAAAESSWIRFDALQSRGIIPPEIRFQVSLPTPLAPVRQFVDAGDRARVEPAYEAAMAVELTRILANIDHQRLAVQWDVAIEVGMLENVFDAWFDPRLEGIVERLARLARAVPADVEMGFHFCYGDAGHAHFIQPRDARRIVTLANATIEAIERPVHWLHMPVPIDRDDPSYFEPLAELTLGPETELYLGLIHHRDGEEGARRRIDAARSYIQEFGVATECGFGRRRHGEIHALMELHRSLSAPVR